VWEGASRPGHFSGVCTVVTKLFATFQPDLAFFGEKDFQQLVVIKRLVQDLDLSVRVVGVPTVREHDGLALSSRNVNLSLEERRAATVLYRALRTAETLALGGEADPAALADAMAGVVADEPLATLDYAAVVDPVTLAEASDTTQPARAVIAARVGATRLIDNMAIVFGAADANR
jgi:pantoate--beta-alanine ligase